MYKYTDHAKKMMVTREIDEHEVQAAIENGELEFTRTDEKGRGTEYSFHRTQEYFSKENHGRMDL